MYTSHEAKILRASRRYKPGQRQRGRRLAQLAADTAYARCTRTVRGSDREHDTVACLQRSAIAPRQREHDACRVRANCNTKTRVVELYVEPAAVPTYVYEATDDRCWDCDAQTTVTFGARNRLKVEYTVGRQDRLDDSFRHLCKL